MPSNVLLIRKFPCLLSQLAIPSRLFSAGTTCTYSDPPQAADVKARVHAISEPPDLAISAADQDH